MDLRSLIDKLDNIEQQRLLTEAEELMEKVRIRYDDVVAVANQYKDDEEGRLAALTKLIKDNNLPGLFDPIKKELVKPDGTYAWFLGANEATVKRLKDWGLLPDQAKTSSWAGARGENEKTAQADNKEARTRDQMVDRAEELMKKAVAVTSAPAREGIAESLLGSFGYSFALLEAITPQEHTELKGLVQKLTPFAKNDPDSADIVAQFRAYNEKRNDLIERIKELIEAIKKLPAPKAAPRAGERSGSATTQESLTFENKDLLLEIELTPAGKKAKAKIYEPTWTGYLSPQQTRHNLNMIKRGYARYTAGDHIAQNMRDIVNAPPLGALDKLQAWASSRNDKNTSYEKELAKLTGQTDFYNRSDQAGNLRNAVRAVHRVSNV